MKRNVATNLFGATAMLLALAPIVASAGTPNPTSVVITERVFNDCPISTVLSTNAYPASISISDSNPACLGFANLHVWRFSDDGSTNLHFDNDASYSFCADVSATGPGECETGLQIGPWWSPLTDGFFNIRTTDGEIACFSGRMPFYSFTGAQGLHYVKGTTVRMEIVYSPNGLSSVSPATIEYRYTDGSGLHTSGPLAYDEANPAENPPHGVWGQLNDASVGGHFKYFLDQSVGEPMNVTWANVCYSNNSAVPVENTTWGGVKALFR